MGRLEGKSAFVTGAGGSIGGAIAERFAMEGARVMCVVSMPTRATPDARSTAQTASS